MTHAVHDNVLAYIADESSATFEALALEVFAHQYEHVLAYRRVCDGQGKTPATVSDWRAIPPVPALAFKHAELWCAAPQRIFLSTGTTQGKDTRSRHGMPDLRLYRAAALRGLKQCLFPDLPSMRIASLVPATVEQPQSSLSQMCAWALESYGAAPSACFAANDRLDFDGLVAALRDSERSAQPLCLLTTTAALMHFFDHCRDHDLAFRLPHSSRVMDTGGSKGAPRTLSRKGLLQAIWNTFAIPGYFAVNEYGMSELSSQYYDNVVRDRHGGRLTHRAKVGPHWMRTRVLDPVTLQDVDDGASGVLCHVDLANAGSAMVVLTEDVGRFVRDGFEVQGRLSGAETRGCSLALQEFTRLG